MTNSRAERMHKSDAARKRRAVKRECALLCKLRKWARAHRERVRAKKRVRSQTDI
jgi:hypothetical protein